MKLMYCDESNLEHRAGDFLLYGGVVIPAEAASELSAGIANLRTSVGIAPDFKLKFNPGPRHLSHQEFRDFKQSVIELAIKHGCKLLTYMVLHDIAGDADLARRNGINTVCYHFHCMLKREDRDAIGVVLIDRFNDEGNKIDAHLTEKMATGIKLPHKPHNSVLDRIVGFHYSAVGQSHFTSLIDILISSMRFVVNTKTRKDEKLQESALNLLKALSPLYYTRYSDGRICDMGIHFSPMTVKVEKYRTQYEEMQKFFEGAGIVSGQSIKGG